MKVKLGLFIMNIIMVLLCVGTLVFINSLKFKSDYGYKLKKVRIAELSDPLALKQEYFKTIDLLKETDAIIIDGIKAFRNVIIFFIAVFMSNLVLVFFLKEKKGIKL